jgi:muramidase (phage lysozyme)
MAQAYQPNPKYKDVLSKVVNDFGMDPNQKIDLNDPMTKLTMTIILTTIEQGRDVYSYSQFIKGCANSIGIDPAVYDSEVNPTSLGFENNSGSAGYVPPTLPSVRRGGSTIPLNPSTYITAGINVALNAISRNSPVSIPTFGGIFSGITNSITGASNFVTGFGGNSGVAGSIPGSGAIYSGTAYNGNDAAILATIRQTETNGNYGAVNYTAVAVGFPKSIDMSNMTLSEVRAYQQSMLSAGASSSAIGPYQMIGTTLDSYAAKAGVSPDTKMTPEVWDKIGSAGVSDALARSGGDISKVPVVWYSGNPNGTGVAPATMAAYQQKWLDNYQTQAAKDSNYQGAGANPNSLPSQYPPGFDVGSATKTTNADGSITYTDQNNQVYTLRNGTWIDPGKDQVVGVSTVAGGQILAYPPGVNAFSYNDSNSDGSKTFVGSTGEAYLLKNGSWYSNGTFVGTAGLGTAALTAAPDAAVVAKGLGIEGQLTVTTQTNADGTFRYASYTDQGGNKFWIDNKGSVTAAIDESGNAIPQNQRQIAQFNSMGTFSQMPSSIDPNNAPLPPRQFADVPLTTPRPPDPYSSTDPNAPSNATLTPNFDRLAPSVKNAPMDVSTLSSSESLKIAQSRVDAATQNLSNLETGAGNSVVNASQRAAAAQEYNDAIVARDQIQNNTPTIQSREIMSDGSIAVVETPVTLGYGSNNIGTQNVITVPDNSPMTVYSDPSSNPPTYGTTGPVQPVGFNTVSFGSSNTITLQAQSPLAYNAPGSNFTTGSSMTLYGAAGMSMTNNGSLIVPTPAPTIPLPVPRPTDLPMDNSLPAGNTVFPADQRQSNSMMGTASTPNYPNYSSDAVRTYSSIRSPFGIGGPNNNGPSAMIMQPDGTMVTNPAYVGANSTGLRDGTIAGGTGFAVAGQSAATIVPSTGTPPGRLIQEINVQQNANAAERAANYDKFDKLDAELKNNPDTEPARAEAIRQEQITLAEKNLDLVNRDIALEDQKTALESQPDQSSTVNVPPDPNTYAYTAETPAGISPAEASGIPQTNQTYGFGDNVSQAGTPSVGGFGISGVTGTTPEGTTAVAQPTSSFSQAAGGDSVSGSSPAGGAASAASPGGAAASASSAAGMAQGC